MTPALVYQYSSKTINNKLRNLKHHNFFLIRFQLGYNEAANENPKNFPDKNSYDVNLFGHN